MKKGDRVRLSEQAKKERIYTKSQNRTGVITRENSMRGFCVHVLWDKTVKPQNVFKGYLEVINENNKG